VWTTDPNSSAGKGTLGWAADVAKAALSELKWGGGVAGIAVLIYDTIRGTTTSGCKEKSTEDGEPKKCPT
jgi:hypothetical protein